MENLANFLGNKIVLSQFFHNECDNIVQTMFSFGSYNDFHEWSTANPKQRKNLRIPSHPVEYYEDQGWKTWPIFLRTKSSFYNECDNIVQTMFSFGSYNNFREWSTANPKERKNLRIPSNPDQEYNGIGWIDWDCFLDKPKPLPVLTVTAGCK